MGLTAKEVRPMADRYTATQHAVGGSTWHFEWCTKYRYKVFSKVHLKTLCTIAITEAAKRHSIRIEAMDVQPDHVHVVAHIPLTWSPSKAVKRLKGVSARLLFMMKPKLRLLYPKGSLWSVGKFVATVGDVDIKHVVNYIKNQEAHHAKAAPAGIPAPSGARGRPKGEILIRGGCQSQSNS